MEWEWLTKMNMNYCCDYKSLRNHTINVKYSIFWGMNFQNSSKVFHTQLESWNGLNVQVYFFPYKNLLFHNNTLKWARQKNFSTQYHLATLY